jgi:tRNA1(Val) A37 N6-methylase TrmN6
MSKYTCESCLKEFLQKSKYETHIKRKTPCVKNKKEKINTTPFVDNNLSEEHIDEPQKLIKYSDLSCKLTKNISKDEKKSQGIYFTPPNTIQTNISLLKPYMNNIKSVLEPSCGSCEYILALNKENNDLDITSVELNHEIYDSIKKYSNEKIQIINGDFLTFDTSKKYDLIIGNPPYFVIKKDSVDKQYYDYFDGRPNIFILFIIRSLNLLNENGILSFILPQNFLNCLYYNKTRQYIDEHFNIIHISECKDSYMETTQKTVLIIIQKKSGTNEQYILKINDYLIFGTKNNIEELKLLYENSTSLSKLNFEVNIGTVVWNQCKKILTDDSTKTRLIYSSDIVNGELILQKYSNNEKKIFIHKKGDTNPLLVINRGYGTGTYNFDYCLIKGDEEYLIENHLITIKYKTSISNSELIKLYNKIIISLNKEKTKKFIELYFGNNAINATELAYILPIYDI